MPSMRGNNSAFVLPSILVSQMCRGDQQQRTSCWKEFLEGGGGGDYPRKWGLVRLSLESTTHNPVHLAS